MPDCPFCPENGQVTIIAMRGGAYLTPVRDRSHGSAVPGRYFVIPQKHVESVMDLPRDFWGSVIDLLPSIPEFGKLDFNPSFNEGEEAGQLVRHVHLWLVFRDEPVEAASYKAGLAKLIRLVNEGQEKVRLLEADAVRLRRKLRRLGFLAALFAVSALASLLVAICMAD